MFAIEVTTKGSWLRLPLEYETADAAWDALAAMTYLSGGTRVVHVVPPAPEPEACDPQQPSAADATVVDLQRALNEVVAVIRAHLPPDGVEDSRWQRRGAKSHLESASRHIDAYMRDVKRDAESGQLNLAHAATRVLFALEQSLRGYAGHEGRR